jgi:hypothetical protein
MVNHYKERFAKIVKVINSDTMKEYSRLNRPKNSTRKNAT